jgi:RimJ/RimL family protein N-acetyltransferase
LIIRDLRATDFEDLCNYYYEFYDEIEENPDLGITLFQSKPTLADELDWFARLFKAVQEGKDVAFVAEENGRVVGLCEVASLLKDHEVSHRGELGISLKKEFRGRGIGRALLRRTLEACTGKFEIIELWVFSTNAVAKSLYAEFGFKSSGRRPRAVKRRGKYIDEEYMYLVL